ncbi:transposase family protein (plasmid) [Streptomyces sp. NBC_00846]|nr:transposase family protein [Streptomyces sp. NBC_00846]
MGRRHPGPPGACPDCEAGTARVRGYHERTVADAPVDGRRVVVRVCVRSFTGMIRAATERLPPKATRRFRCRAPAPLSTPLEGNLNGPKPGRVTAGQRRGDENPKNFPSIGGHPYFAAGVHSAPYRRWASDRGSR